MIGRTGAFETYSPISGEFARAIFIVGPPVRTPAITGGPLRPASACNASGSGAIRLARRLLVLDCDVPALDEARLAKPHVERDRIARGDIGAVDGRDHRHRRLLHPRRKRREFSDADHHRTAN
jgi:hypothetical protein